jgi:DnaJ-class molecular chaperone
MPAFSRFQEMCILLNDAWELLSDPEKRKDYDAQIEPLTMRILPRISE